MAPGAWLEGDCRRGAPSEGWVADFTYVRCWEGMAFFAFILDVHSRFLVGWQFAGHMRDTLVIDALEMAVGQRHPDPSLDLVHHSDRGSQGEFNWSSQRSIETRLRWAGRFGLGSVLAGR